MGTAPDVSLAADTSSARDGLEIISRWPGDDLESVGPACTHTSRITGPASSTSLDYIEFS
jgi:hypothetical protein